MLTQLEDGEVDLALAIFPNVAGHIQKETLFPEQSICLADKGCLHAQAIVRANIENDIAQ